jgi:hypothetical protein
VRPEPSGAVSIAGVSRTTEAKTDRRATLRFADRLIS